MFKILLNIYFYIRLGYTLAEICKLSRKKTAGLKYYGMIADETHDKIVDKVNNEELKYQNHHYFSDQNFEIQPSVSLLQYLIFAYAHSLTIIILAV